MAFHWNQGLPMTGAVSRGVWPALLNAVAEAEYVTWPPAPGLP
jgi:hypothetical protein